MRHRCPRCWSARVERRAPEVRRFAVLLRYRCAGCDHQFWSMPHRTRVRLATIASVALVGVGTSAWTLHDGLWPAQHPQSRSTRASLDAQASSPLVTPAFARVEGAAHDASAGAVYELAVALRDGRGVRADPERALALLRMAADAGVARAQFELGRAYAAGIGVKRDIAQAFAWLSLAAANGLADAGMARDALLLTMSPGDVLLAHREARRVLVAQRQRNDPSRAVSSLDAGGWLGEE